MSEYDPCNSQDETPDTNRRISMFPDQTIRRQQLEEGLNLNTHQQLGVIAIDLIFDKVPLVPHQNEQRFLEIKRKMIKVKQIDNRYDAYEKLLNISDDVINKMKWLDTKNMNSSEPQEH